ncbi:MAG TPA: hypothetical protein VF950_27075 [Planctomycetota bacterium]
MWRFAAAITILEIILTAFTATLFTIDGEPDPYLTPDDLREINLPFEGHRTARQNRFDALLGYETHATFLRPRQTLWLSVRVDQARVDFDSRRRREENWALKPAFGKSAILDDPGHDDAGYTVRHHTATGARCELVRFRNGRMLVVKVSSSERAGSADEEVASCERRARIVQERMFEKLRWWNGPVTAGPR